MLLEAKEFFETWIRGVGRLANCVNKEGWERRPSARPYSSQWTTAQVACVAVVTSG